MNLKTLLAVAETYKAMLNPPAKETISEATQRPKWMPESISNEDVSHFMGAVAKAHSAGQKHFEFGGKKYKVTMKPHVAQKIAGNATSEEVDPATGDLKDACWKGYTAVGTKQKDGKTVPNCVPTNEALDPNAEAGVWIKDFIASDAPQFAGKSQEERKDMALAAWYNARREAGIKEEESAEIKHDNVVDKREDEDEMPEAPVQEEKDETEDEGDEEDEKVAKTDDAKENPTEVEDAEIRKVNENVAGDPYAASLSAKANSASALAHSSHTAKHHEDAQAAHRSAAELYRVYAHHGTGQSLRSAAQIHHTFHDDMARHHMLHLVSSDMDKPSSVKEEATEKAVEGPKKEEQEKLEPRSPGEKKFYNAHKDKVEIKDGNPLDSQDGTDKIVAAEKPAPSNTSAAAPKPDVEAPVKLPAGAEEVKKATPPQAKK